MGVVWYWLCCMGYWLFRFALIVVDLWVLFVVALKVGLCLFGVASFGVYCCHGILSFSYFVLRVCLSCGMLIVGFYIWFLFLFCWCLFDVFVLSCFACWFVNVLLIDCLFLRVIIVWWLRDCFGLRFDWWTVYIA